MLESSYFICRSFTPQFLAKNSFHQLLKDSSESVRQTPFAICQKLAYIATCSSMLKIFGVTYMFSSMALQGYPHYFPVPILTLGWTETLQRVTVEPSEAYPSRVHSWNDYLKIEPLFHFNNNARIMHSFFKCSDQNDRDNVSLVKTSRNWFSIWAFKNWMHYSSIIKQINGSIFK